MPLKPNQIKAIKKLEAAFLACKRANLVFAGECDNLLFAPISCDLQRRIDMSDSVHAVMSCPDGGLVKTYRTYLDGGAA